MERRNNIYGEIINSKFSQFTSANMNVTWKGMKDLLDKEMPEKKKRKWFLWFTTRAGIITIVLFSLFASAAGIYLGLTINKQEENNITPVSKEEAKKEIATSPLIIQIEEGTLTQSGSQIIEIAAGNKTHALLASQEEVIENNKEAMISSDIRKGKTGKSRASTKPIIVTEQNNNITDKLIPVKYLQLKDSIVIPEIITIQPETVEKRRAF